MQMSIQTETWTIAVEASGRTLWFIHMSAVPTFLACGAFSALSFAEICTIGSWDGRRE
ncbi:hypothetical protein RAD15_31800 [Bradyrhizobium sp. 14AA]